MSIAMAREVVRQEIELELLTRTTIKADVDRGGRLLDELLAESPDGVSVREVLDLLRDAREKLKPARWADCCSALLWVLDDEMYADYNLVETTFARVADRLADRIKAKAERRAKSPEKVQGEMVRLASRIVETIGAALDPMPMLVEHPPSDARGVRQWISRHPCLPSTAGPDEERRAYAQGDFPDLERRALDRYFADRLPPLGMYYTFAAVASDVFGRYGCTRKPHMLYAVGQAEDVFDFVVELNGL